MLLLPCAVALLALLLCPQPSEGTQWKSCGTGSFDVQGVQLTPEKVPPGSTATFVIDAQASEPAGGGRIDMLVTYMGVPIWKETDNLCDKADCPIVPGPARVTFTQPFPPITPPGTYTVQLKCVADGEKALFCVEVTFQVVPPGWLSMGHAEMGAALQEQ